jgi:hypothetical protein
MASQILYSHHQQHLVLLTDVAVGMQSADAIRRIFCKLPGALQHV